jgi:NadR type nicotinamide-nucleotide adenylyltransferase
VSARNQGDPSYNENIFRLEIKKVVILGPECTGKSELSEYLANEFNTHWVPEYAREYINNLSRPYGPQDLPSIARGQLLQEDLLASRANKVLICDTDLYVIKVWSYFKFGFCDIEVLKSIEARKYDLYLLTYIDIPWVPDPQREHPDQRELLYEIYLEEMKNQPVPFVEIKGTREQRRKLAKTSVSNLLRNSIDMAT